MEQEKLENQDSLTPEGEENTLKPQDEKPEKDSSDETSKFKELSENYKTRAEKAERELKEFRSKPDEPKSELSQVDVITLAKADIHEDDIDEVLDLAKFKKISVKEALSSNVMKSILAERKEERKTAEATSAGAKRLGTKAKSGEELLGDAETGKFPDSEEGIKELVEAHFKSKARK